MKTVRVRIPVVVNDRGDWVANGASGSKESQMIDVCKESLEQGPEERVYFIEANVEVPAPVVLLGDVTKE